MPAISDQDRLKLAAAQAAAVLVENGMIVGLGSGSTASLAVTEIGKRVAGGLRITGIPTSEKTAAQARSLGIPLSTLAEHDHIDLTIDGADEVEIGTLHLVKGLGGALLREKIVATNTERLVIVADETKLVNRLGIDNRPVPLEVVPFGWQATAKHLRALGATFVLRPGADGKPFVTDGGHYTLDCVFGPIESPERLQEKLDGMVGVVEHGLFLGLTSEVLMATETGVTTMK
jgi:ribose 5-phosphate isomerase A